VTLEKLAGRAENGTKERAEAQRMMEEMEMAIQRGEKEIHCFSTRVVDRNGELLVGYFAQSPNLPTLEVSPRVSNHSID
jgi:hypothetical protein